MTMSRYNHLTPTAGASEAPPGTQTPVRGILTAVLTVLLLFAALPSPASALDAGGVLAGSPVVRNESCGFACARNAAGSQTIPLLAYADVLSAPLRLAQAWAGDTHFGNHPPMAEAGIDQTVGVGDTVRLDGSGSSDVDGDPLTYTWDLTRVPPGSTTRLSDPSTVQPTFEVDQPGAYAAALVVHDALESGAPDTVAITTEDSPPVAEAGPDQTARVAETVTLDGGNSADVDGDPLTYRWDLISVPAGSAARLSDATAMRPTFEVDLPGTYAAALVVYDGTLDSAPDTVTVSTENSPPVAAAGLDQSVFVGDLAQLDGRASADVDGDRLGFAWSLLSVPAGSAAVLSEPNAVSPSFAVDTPGSYVAQLIVHDGLAASAPATVTVTTQNSPPVAEAGPDQSAFVGDWVTLDGSASTDADGDPLTYRWSLLGVPAGSAAGLSEPAAVNPSFALDTPGTYGAQLIVHDGTVAGVPDAVLISTVNSRPLAQPGPDQVVAAGQTVSLDASASTDADGDPLRYQWSFSVQPQESQATLSDPQAPDPRFTADQPGRYVVQLIVDDGQLSSAPVTVVIDTRDAPGSSISSTPTPVPTEVAPHPTAAAAPPSSEVSTDARSAVSPSPATERPSGRDERNGGAAASACPPGAAKHIESWTYPGGQAPYACVADPSITAGPAVHVSASAEVLYAAPVVALNPGFSVASGGVFRVTTALGSADADGDGLSDALEALLGSQPGVVDSDGDGLTDGAEVLTYGTSPTHADSDGDGFDDDLEVSAGSDPRDPTETPENFLPPDPATVAPPLDTTVPTSVYDVTEFLYTGPDPIQTGVAAGAIEQHRAVLLRGKVMSDDGAPLAGVTISLLGHPELGQTLTREDGLFDLAVNGGGVLVVNYARAHYLPAQRKIEARWRDYEWLPDVVLKQRDARVTPIDVSGSTAMQVARGSVVSDADGTRQATVLFPPGTTAELVLPGGGTQPVDNLSVRATEYTVGAMGPLAMPGELPPTSGYTYAVELTADEAVAKVAGRDILFNQPVSFYIENFLDLPVGIDVPVGYYDADQGAWVPSEDGHIIQILDITGGIAAIDVDGSGTAADAAALAELGISDAERTRLAALYAPGQSLWRSPMSHFSNWDTNMGFGPDPDAPPPNNGFPLSPFPEPDPCEQEGSIIECQNQALGETVAVAGTPFTLNYRSNRMDGFGATRQLTIPLSGDTLHPTLLRIDLEVRIAGQLIKETFPAQANLETTIDWDGRDVYGRPMQGTVPADISIGYVYESFYYDQTQLAAAYRSFGHSGNGTRMSAAVARTRSPITLWQDYQTTVSTWDPRPQGLGGWTLDVHHAYDPAGTVLYQGDGTERRVGQVDRVLTRVYRRAVDSNVIEDIAVDQAGNIYLAQRDRVIKVAPDGTSSVVAGGNDNSDLGDGGPAVDAHLGDAQGIAVDALGNFYIADTKLYRVRKVDANGIITTVAGNGQFGTTGDGGLATEAALCNPVDVEVDAAGNLYINTCGLVRKVSADGYITTIAGGGSLTGDAAEGRQATEIRFQSNLQGIALDRQGNLYLSQNRPIARIWRVSPDGVLRTFAGVGTIGFSGDGGPAREAQLSDPKKIAIDEDGTVFFIENYPYAPTPRRSVRMVTSSGYIYTVAGKNEDPSQAADNQGKPALQSEFSIPVALAVDTEQHVLIGDQNARTIWKMSPAFPGVPVSISDTLLVSENGEQVYVFDHTGRHKRTLHALTGATLFEFAYDAAGRLETVVDGDNNITRIERDAGGNPTAIVAPFGQRTVLTVNADGYLASVANPENETHEVAYQDAGGLLTRFETPRDFATQATYDALGYLTRVDDPAGGFKTLKRTRTEDGFEVVLTTAEGRVTTYAVEEDPNNGDQRRVNTFPDGTQREMTIKENGITTIAYADGTQVSLTRHPDPRWEMQAPLVDVLITTPGGLSYEAISKRTAVLADPLDLLSLQTQTQTTTINGRVFTSVYDAGTRTTTTTSAAGRTVETVIDAQGRMTELGVDGVTPVTLTYDARGRLSTLAQGIRDLVLNYDADSGFLVSLTDALDQVTSLDRDTVGRVTEINLPDTSIWSASWDDSGNLSALVEPDGTTTHAFGYTPVELFSTYTSPLAAVDSLVYDRDRRLTRRENPSGDGTDWTYNAKGQLTTLTTPEGSHHYTFDAATGLMDTASSRDGQQTTYGYDGSLRTAATRSGVVDGEITYSYDNDLRVSELAYADQTLPMTYDEDGLLTGVGSIALSRDPQNGLLLQVADGGFEINHTYDPFADVQSTSATQGATALYDVTYAYDLLGRIATKTETIGGATQVWSYAYDALGQLVEVQRDGAVVETYSYDAVGNRVAMTSSLTGQNLPAGSFTYDDDNKLLQAGATTYTYDPDGRLATATTGGNTTTYTYNTEGTLTSVQLPSGQTISYLYDDRGRRIARAVDGVRTHAWLYREGLRPVAELDGAGDLRQSFVFAASGTPMRLIRDGQAYHILSDHLGSPRLVVDAAGSVVKQIDYDSFGQVILDTNPGFDLPFGFAGGHTDPDHSLIRFGARDYDPSVGRWTNKDSIGFGGGDTNLYAYSSNDPVNRIDPTGLAWGFGISLNFDVIFGYLSGGGGSAGINIQYLSDQGLGVYPYGPGDQPAGGLSIGFGVQFNVAWGAGGPWYGDFYNVGLSYGEFCGSYFSSDPLGNEPAWEGISFGLGIGAGGGAFSSNTEYYSLPSPPTYYTPPVTRPMPNDPLWGLGR